MSAKVIAGNWKMNHGPRTTRNFFTGYHPSAPAELRPDVLLFPPAISLEAAVRCGDRAPGVAIGVQNIHWEESGAYTGEVSAPMAVEAGATHALIGHSERRHVFGESDEQVTRKVRAALRAGLRPVVCVGETLDERRAARVEEVILRQLDAALAGVREPEGEGDGAAGLMVAYEPVWAIGTGETATPQDASEAHAVLRGRLAARFGADVAEDVPILYGGSVKPDNAAELLAAPGVDGVLVGGASLDPGSFARIVEAGAGHGAGPGGR